jgi:peptidoglycan/xylan/chitin deacetylase (PgdA/CDA1 family)
MNAANLLKCYYAFKPIIPRSVQIFLRRYLAIRKRRLCADVWPIDMNSAKPPDGWKGWPEGKRFALVLTHDVEAAAGVAKCRDLMRLEQERGFMSSFNFVPGDYATPPELRAELKNNGFEVGVHGWTHDGSLYRNREIFLEQAQRINDCLKEWNAVGFRSPAMHHNLDWIRDLDIEYDLSTFDTDPFEPQSDGMGTIFPFDVKGDGSRNGYIELPYTLPQDFTLFVILKEKSIDVWKRKIDWIADQGGMVLLNTHPDYMNFTNTKPGREKYPSLFYREMLEFMRTSHKGEYWPALPKDVARFWAGNYINRTGKHESSGKPDDGLLTEPADYDTDKACWK